MYRQKFIVGLGIAWLFVTAGGLHPVYGQPGITEGASEPSTIGLGHALSLTIGLDVWPNQWVKSNATFPIAGTNVGQISAFSVGFIPNATLTYQRFFLSTSYMVNTGYQFGK